MGNMVLSEGQFKFSNLWPCGVSFGSDIPDMGLLYGSMKIISSIM